MKGPACLANTVHPQYIPEPQQELANDTSLRIKPIGHQGLSYNCSLNLSYYIFFEYYQSFQSQISLPLPFLFPLHLTRHVISVDSSFEMFLREQEKYLGQDSENFNNMGLFFICYFQFQQFFNSKMDSSPLLFYLPSFSTFLFTQQGWKSFRRSILKKDQRKKL